MGDQQHGDKVDELTIDSLAARIRNAATCARDDTFTMERDLFMQLCGLAQMGLAAEESPTRSAVVASVTEEGFTQQIHFMQRQSQMLAEQGDDVASRVMAEAAQMVADVWQDRERYRKGMANWKATAEAKDREFAQSATVPLGYIVHSLESMKCDGMKSDFFKGVNDGLDRALEVVRAFKNATDATNADSRADK